MTDYSHYYYFPHIEQGVDFDLLCMLGGICWTGIDFLPHHNKSDVYYIATEWGELSFIKGWLFSSNYVIILLGHGYKFMYCVVYFCLVRLKGATNTLTFISCINWQHFQCSHFEIIYQMISCLVKTIIYG